MTGSKKPAVSELIRRSVVVWVEGWVAAVGQAMNHLTTHRRTRSTMTAVSGKLVFGNFPQAQYRE